MSPVFVHSTAEPFFCKERFVSRKAILENNWQIFMTHAGKVGITTCGFEEIHPQLRSALGTAGIPWVVQEF